MKISLRKVVEKYQTLAVFLTTVANVPLDIKKTASGYKQDRHALVTSFREHLEKNILKEISWHDNFVSQLHAWLRQVGIQSTNVIFVGRSITTDLANNGQFFVLTKYVTISFYDNIWNSLSIFQSFVSNNLQGNHAADTRSNITVQHCIRSTQGKFQNLEI